ncbi:MAG: 4-hydroxy-tetrahydrodipicolinate synthase [Mariprofundaceae bacterium]|nr:4-hydroxy-tetrahydrodipicolinate synthase [Mariprofundaceae bacterium]
MFHGVMTALVTPFKIDADGRSCIDKDAYCAHLDRQIAAGVDGVVPAGTTGEAATLSFEEHKSLIELTVQHVAGRVPVIAGTGSNNTAESIALTQAAKQLGADAALLISPYYNKPMQEGIYQHYKAVANAVHLPQILYNVPGRTNSNLSPETVARLSQCNNIIGIKDATADLSQLTCTMMACGDGFEFYSGDDATVLPFMGLGGHGVISVVSNIAPKTMKALTTNMAGGDLETARKAHFALQNLSDAMFVQSNPIPVKAACELMGWMSGGLRLPLTSLHNDDVRALRETMIAFASAWETLELADFIG